jgi:preprotein translocase subunit SecD
MRPEKSRIVGPSLRRHSIRQGLTAGLVGTLLAVGFTVSDYYMSGVVAVFAVGLNTLLLLVELAYLQATLTLPGIAGMVLSIGVIIDTSGDMDGIFVESGDDPAPLQLSMGLVKGDGRCCSAS